MVQGSVEARREPGSNSPVFLSSHLQSFVGLEVRPKDIGQTVQKTVAGYVSPKAREPRKYIQLCRAQSRAEEGRE